VALAVVVDAVAAPAVDTDRIEGLGMEDRDSVAVPCACPSL